MEQDEPIGLRGFGGGFRRGGGWGGWGGRRGGGGWWSRGLGFPRYLWWSALGGWVPWMFYNGYWVPWWYSLPPQYYEQQIAVPVRMQDGTTVQRVPPYPPGSWGPYRPPPRGDQGYREIPQDQSQQPVRAGLCHQCGVAPIAAHCGGGCDAAYYCGQACADAHYPEHAQHCAKE